MIQSRGCLGLFLNKLAGPVMNVGIALAKNILASLGITAADAGIQKKIQSSGTTTLIIPNKKMNSMMKIVQALKDSNILLNGVTETIKNETNKQSGGFLRS